MKIKIIDNNIILFDMENGHVMKTKCKMIREGFLYEIFINSMTKWEPPYENALVSQSDINNIIEMVKQKRKEMHVKIFFDNEVETIEKELNSSKRME